MTETYAATIAAVVPVIWLVAAVEVHQFVKHFENLQGPGRQIAEARRYLESLGGNMGFEHHAQLDRLLRSIDYSTVTPPKVKYKLAFAYLVVVAVLLAAETAALLWLGSPQSPSSGLAWFCLLAVLVGFLAVSVLPGLASLLITVNAQRGQIADMRWMHEYLHRHQEEVRRREGGGPEA